MRTALALILLTSLNAHAYGNRSIENAVVKAVDCTYKTVSIDLGQGPVDYLWNPHLMVVEGNSAITRTAKTVDPNKTTSTISISPAANANLSGPIYVTDIKGGTQTTYYADAAKLKSEIYRDRMNTCAELANSARTQQPLKHSLPIAFIANAELGAPSFGQPSLNFSRLTYRMEMGDRLKAAIRANAYCKMIATNVSNKSVLPDGTVVENCYTQLK